MTDQRATVAFWHRFPRDSAWRAVTLEHMAAQGFSIEPTCRSCWHRGPIYDPLAFAEQFAVPPATPILTVQAALRCSACGLPAGYFHGLNPAVHEFTGYPARER